MPAKRKFEGQQAADRFFSDVETKPETITAKAQVTREEQPPVRGVVHPVEVSREDMFKPGYAQNIHDADDAHNAYNTHNTHKAHKTRINLVMPDEYDHYTRVMSRIQGTSVTAFINELIRKDMERNAAVYEQAKELVKNAR